MRLRDKVVLVTGAGQGIGRGIALRCAEEGARVIIADLLDDADSRHTLALVEKAGGEGCVLAADVASVDAVRGLVAEGANRMGRIDVLVNNAGIELFAPFAEV